MAAPTASACLRRLSERVNSVRTLQAAERSIISATGRRGGPTSSAGGGLAGLPLVDRLLGQHPLPVVLERGNAALGGHPRHRLLVHGQVQRRLLDAHRVLGNHIVSFRSSDSRFYGSSRSRTGCFSASSSTSSARVRARRCSTLRASD